jgi:DNA repair exonuclease SbcCD nuclease subunit
MNYTLKALALLNESFETVYFINGNHDLYYRDTRALNSIEFNKLLSNFIQINEPIVKDNVAFVPWLVGDEWKQIQKIKCKYMFGHFELPHFYMNAKIQMPDLGGLKEEKFKHPELVFSGHFHTRQAKDKIIYIGNAFPHNYADAWDDERGMMMLDWGHDPEFIAWPDQPTYRTLTLSLLLEDPEKFLQKKTNARINLDIDITYEEANFLKELFTDIFKLRDFALLPTKDTEHEEGVIGKIQFQSIDQIVISHLQNIKSDTFDSRVLIAIYNSLQYAKN